MIDLNVGIRIVVRALLVRDGEVLVQHKVYADGSECFTLPGGGVDLGETLIEGLRRECREEIDAQVDVTDLIHVADYFKLRDTQPPTTRQQLEILFRCRLPDDYVPHNGAKPDKFQVDVLWLDAAQLCHKNFTPQGLCAVIGQSISSKAVARPILHPETKADAKPGTGPVYLGLID